MKVESSFRFIVFVFSLKVAAVMLTIIVQVKQTYGIHKIKSSLYPCYYTEACSDKVRALCPPPQMDDVALEEMSRDGKSLETMCPFNRLGN